MGIDHGRRRGKEVRQEVSKPGYAEGGTQLEQQMWAHGRENYDVMRDGLRAKWWMHEHYRQQDYEQSERVRHYHDLIAGRPAVPEYNPIDYSQLPRPHEVVPPEQFVVPPYPGIPPPMFYRPPARGEGSSSQSQMTSPWDMAHGRENYDVIRDGLRAIWWMQEHYQQQNYEQSERVRHYHDLIADRPAVPEYTPIDYSQLPRPHEVVPPEQFVAPPYPGIPPPMFFRPPAGGEGGSSQSRVPSPWDMAPLARSLYESLFSDPPPGPQ